MLRAIVAVVLGVFAMWIVAFALVAGAYSALGPDRVFESGTWVTTPVWNGAGLGAGFVAAAVGGLVCAAVGRSWGPVVVLGAIVLGLRLAYGDCPSYAAHRSVISVIETSTRDAPPARMETPTVDDLCHAQEPAWVAYVNPVVGVAGAVVGGWVVRRRPSGRRPESA